MKHLHGTAATVLFLSVLLPSIAAAADPIIPGTVGAISIPVAMPVDGRATIALYTDREQLVRILAQAIDLRSGKYVARWDGMDLWGNLLPADTHLVAKVIAGPGLRAFYEFSPGRGEVDPAASPWLTRPVGEGLAMRTGGWLGDHTGPSAAAAIGDKVFLGSALVEYGHNLIACDLDGRKLWGLQLSGWDGPQQLLVQNGALLARAKSGIFRIDPDTYRSERLVDTGKTNLVTMGAGPEQLLLLLENPAARTSPFRFAFEHDDIDFDRAEPSVAGDSAPEFQISPRRAFSSVFASEGGHFQTGLRPVVRDGAWHVVVPLKRDRPVGTLVIGRLAGATHVEARVLPAGTAYEPTSTAWLAFGQADLTAPLTILTAPQPNLQTRAIHLKFTGPAVDAPKPPTLTVCRALALRVTAAAVVKPVLPTGMTNGAAAGGWRFHTAAPVSEEAPAVVRLDATTSVAWDGLLFLNNTSTRYTVDVPDGEAARSLGEFTARSSAKMGSDSASRLDRTSFLAFTETAQTRSVRLNVQGGYGKGRVGLRWTEGDPALIEADAVVALRVVDPQEKVPPHILRVCAAQDGRTLTSTPCDASQMRGLTQDRDGTIYAVLTNALVRCRLDAKGLRYETLNDRDLPAPMSVVLLNDQLVVGDRNGVRFFDRQGRLQRQLGGQPYVRGPWDRNRTVQSKGVTVDARGNVWVAEEAYSPKRVARFGADGTCQQEIFGPPQYGGGGWLDPNLKSFYYHGLEFALDWERGTDRLAFVNDRLYSEETPTLDVSAFGYTQAGRVVVRGDRRYAVGDPGFQFSPGPVVSLLEGHAWRPAATMGTAKGNPFLLRKEGWKRHWQQQNLEDKYFVWCDRNDDGVYQTEEVELFTKTDCGADPFNGGYWGVMIAPDLTIWTHEARWAPSRFTAKGVPIYERKDIQPFRYKNVAPFYAASQAAGSRAASGPSDCLIVGTDGALTMCGQPYRVLPDLTVAGGPVTATPSDYVPPVNGRLITQALHFAGAAPTRSPVGEVAMVVGDNGVWSLCSLRYGVMLDRIFTGLDGNWGSDFPSQRNTEVTGRKHDQETFFGHFLRGDDGNYYTVSGKGFHAISRVEGLDALTVTSVPVTVSTASIAPNTALRAQLAALAKSGRDKGEPHILKAVAIGALKAPFALDGQVEEWTSWQALEGATPPLVQFAAAYDDRGLTLAYKGQGYVGNRCEDPVFLFKGGFAFDFRYRVNPKARNELAAGDRRIVFGRHRGAWIAMLYDYVNPDVPRDRVVAFTSPVVETLVDKVERLSDADLKLAVTLGSAFAGQTPWSAEVFVPWARLGFAGRPNELKFDAGLLVPDSGGITVERRLSWVSHDPLPVSDVGWESRIDPTTWATMEFK